MDNRTSDYGSQRGPGALVRDPLAWAANNARIIAMNLLMEKGARGDSLHALHAAAWGGSSYG
jgi:hypothetical protein